jgi:hypothetical protein
MRSDLISTAMVIADTPPPENSDITACIPPPVITAEDRDRLLDSDFKEIRDTKLIPTLVKKQFAKDAQSGKFDMANPGEEFQVTDVIDKPGLPWTRLVFAGSSGDRFFIYYKHGGIGHSWNLAVNNQTTGCAIWSGSGTTAVNTIDDLKKALRQGKFVNWIS